MDSDVMAFAQVMAVIMASLAVLVGVVIGARFFWQIGSRVGGPAIPASTSAEELQRLQNAVDAIAIEVERISEAQRFTVTLLSNRLPPPGAEGLQELPARGKRSRADTPN
jgi:hypothetical protein